MTHVNVSQVVSVSSDLDANADNQWDLFWFG